MTGWMKVGDRAFNVSRITQVVWNEFQQEVYFFINGEEVVVDSEEAPVIWKHFTEGAFDTAKAVELEARIAKRDAEIVTRHKDIDVPF